MRSSKIEAYQYIKGVQVLAERGVAKSCSICQKGFGMLTQEHQCKRCLRPVCEKCSPNKGISYKDNKKHRQCNLCKDEIERLLKFIDEYKVCFLVDSIALEWLRSLNITPGQAKSEYYEDSIKAKEANDISEYNSYKSSIGSVFKEIQIGQNYSIKEFFIQCLKQNSKERVFESVEQVMDVFLKMNPEISYSADMIMIALFLLFFGSVPTTYVIMKRIYQRILPQQITNRQHRFKSYDFAEEIQNIVSINQLLNKPISQPFLVNRIHRYISTLTVNLFLFETTFHIINESLLSHEPYSMLIKQISLCLNMNNIEVLNMGEDYPFGELILLRNNFVNKLQSLMIKTRGMSVTFTNTDTQGSLKRDSNQQDDMKSSQTMKDSQVLSLKSEISQQKVMSDALLFQVETLKNEVLEKDMQIDELKKDLATKKCEIMQLKERNDQLLRISPETNVVEELLQARQYQEFNKELQDQILELQAQLRQLQQANHQYYSQLEQQKIYMADIKKMQTRYEVSLNEDPMFNQDIKDMEQGLDPVKKKLFAGFIDLITQLKADLKLKELELKLRKEEVIQNPVIEQLKKELGEMENELNSANLQIIELKKRTERLSIQNTIRKRDQVQPEQQVGCSPNQECTIF